jgi:hypothetical protein
MTSTCHPCRSATAHRLAWLRAAVLCLASVACTTGSLNVPAAPPQARVLIGLPANVSAADAAWLTRLTDAAGTPLALAATVSPGWAAYVMNCPSQDTDCTEAIEKLRRSGLVRSIERDERRSVP